MIRINLSGTPEWIRTTDLLLRRQTLYPAELRAHKLTLVPLLYRTPTRFIPVRYATMLLQTNFIPGEVPEWSKGAVC
jgi:hypothetical protein